jgi:hypothetical protein
MTPQRMLYHPALSLCLRVYEKINSLIQALRSACGKTQNRRRIWIFRENNQGLLSCAWSSDAGTFPKKSVNLAPSAAKLSFYRPSLYASSSRCIISFNVPRRSMTFTDSSGATRTEAGKFIELYSLFIVCE